jgi:hypothetical protein
MCGEEAAASLNAQDALQSVTENYRAKYESLTTAFFDEVATGRKNRSPACA